MLFFSILCAETVIRVAVYENHPLVFTSEDGQIEGLYIDILNEIAQKEGWTLIYVGGTFTECLDLLAQGWVELMVAIAYTDERAERFNYNQQAVLTNWGRIYIREKSPITTILDLKDKKIAYVEKDIYYEDLRDKLAKFDIPTDFVVVDDYDGVFRLIDSGEVDAGIVARFYGRIHESRFDLVPSGIIFKPIELRFASRKESNATLLKMIDRHLEQMKSDPQSAYYKAINRWLNITPNIIDQGKENQSKIFQTALFSFALLCLVALIIILSSRRKIRAKMMTLFERDKELESEISFRRKAEQETYRNQMRYSQIIEAMNEGFARITVNGQIKYANEPFCRLVGADRKDIHRYKLADFIHELSERDIASGFAARENAPRSVSLEVKIKPLEGAPIPVIISINQVYGISPDDLGSFVIVTNISEVSARLEELEVQKAYFEQLFENSPTAIALVNNRDEVMMINTSFSRMFQYQPEECIGKTINSLIVPMELYDEASGYSNMVLNKQTIIHESKRMRKDGASIDVAIMGYPIFMSEEQIGVFAIYRDITDHNTAVKDLQTAQDRFKMIFNSTPVALYLERFADKIIDCNEAAQTMTGYTRDELLGMSVVDLVPKSRVDDIMKVARDAKALGWFATEFVNARKNGDEFPVIMSGSMMKVNNEDHVIIAIQDITRQKMADKALAAEKEHLSVILASIVDAVIATDIEGRVTLLNQVASELTGWTVANAMNKPISEVFNLVDESTRSPINNPVTNLLQSGNSIELEEQSMLVSTDGSEHLIIYSAAPIHDHSGNAVGLVLVFRDITEKHALEREIMKIQKMETLSLLAGGIAHDFNNILTAIIGNISIAKIFATEHPKITEKITNAEKAALQARDLTHQLLTFSKGGDPIKQTTNLIEIVKETVSFVMSGSNVKSDLDFADNLDQVNVDPGQISQVVNNLVLNALQAMKEGGILKISACNVAVKPEQIVSLKPGLYVKLTIVDNGPGIPQEFLDKIFDPYFTTKEEGNGLGLSMTYSIIKNHKGHIQVESRPGEGARFDIFLPSTTESIETGKAKVQDIQGQHQSILVMDDDQIVKDSIGNFLEFLQYRVDFADHGEEAIDKYREALESNKPYAAVILDLTVPGAMGGKECIKHLMEMDPDIRAIASSGYSSNLTIENFREYGFLDVIPKPYKIEEIGAVLKRVIVRP